MKSKNYTALSKNLPEKNFFIYFKCGIKWKFSGKRRKTECIQIKKKNVVGLNRETFVFLCGNNSTPMAFNNEMNYPNKMKSSKTWQKKVIII